MNTYLVCLTAALSAGADADGPAPLMLPDPFVIQSAAVMPPELSGLPRGVVPDRPRSEMPIIRGQSPAMASSPVMASSPAPWIGPAPVRQTAAIPVADNAGTWNAFAPVVPPDPFLQGPVMVNPYGPAPGTTTLGANGPQPYRVGWQSRVDLGYLPKESTNAGSGFEVFELDTDFEYTTPTPGGMVYSFTQQFNLRGWDGPSSFMLPGNVYHVGWDFEVSTPANGPVSFQLGFNPSINSDFEGSLSSRAWNFDGRGMVFYRMDRFWTLVLGAGYWDRVNDRVVPYAGLIYTDDLWEWRVMFPESRVSVFVGNELGCAKWLYVRAQYNVESYEIDNPVSGISSDQIELADWRILLGARMDAGWWNWFLEGGWVFGRETDFLRNPTGFDITSGFIGRIGIRF